MHPYDSLYLQFEGPIILSWARSPPGQTSYFSVLLISGMDEFTFPVVKVPDTWDLPSLSLSQFLLDIGDLSVRMLQIEVRKRMKWRFFLEQDSDIWKPYTMLSPWEKWHCGYHFSLIWNSRYLPHRIVLLNVIISISYPAHHLPCKCPVTANFLPSTMSLPT